MKSFKNNPDGIYQPGDIIGRYGEDGLQIDSNHCGLPWPVDFEGNLFCGCVVIHERPFESTFLDARTGERLNASDIELRKNNMTYDYNRRWQDNCGRRYPVPKWSDLLTCSPTRWISVIQSIRAG